MAIPRNKLPKKTGLPSLPEKKTSGLPSLPHVPTQNNQSQNTSSQEYQDEQEFEPINNSQETQYTPQETINSMPPLAPPDNNYNDYSQSEQPQQYSDNQSQGYQQDNQQPSQQSTNQNYNQPPQAYNNQGQENQYYDNQEQNYQQADDYSQPNSQPSGQEYNQPYIEGQDNGDDDSGFVQLTSKEVRDEDAADNFEQQTTNEFTDDKIEENYEQPPKKTISKAKKKKKKKNKKGIVDDPFLKGTDTQAEDDDINIDKKKRRLIPFGGDKSKPRREKTKKFKGDSRFDDRKDKGKAVKWLRFSVMLCIVIVVIIGLKNTFFRSVPNDDKIASIARQVNGDTGFPTQRGQALAEQFTEAYLNFDASNTNDRTLAYFYNGSEKPMAIPDVSTRALQGAVKQKVLVAPKTFDSIVPTEDSAIFYVSTLVSDIKGEQAGKEGEQTSRWVALAVNVLYDKKHNQLEISANSPTLIPSFKVSNGHAFSSQSEAPLGTGNADDDAYKSMQSTIVGFLSAYADSTPTNHSKLNQYIENNPDDSVVNGFNGKFDFSSDSSNFTGTAYPSSKEETNAEWKVDLKISWKDADSTKNDSVAYTGRYVMTVQKKGGKYFVEKFVPYTYSKNTAE